ncbi:MAG: NAD(P)-dependent oxidoreductase, partial [Micromonosporaceae bacterium]|nr:NAD(P)-dependent oxidoreductase [Micromonosporaceae bacterium]
MHLLLTGASGNIGSHTLPQLLRAGHRVRCLALPDATHRRWAARLPAGAQVAWGDIRNAPAVAAAVQGVEAVVHLAAVIPPASEERPGYAREVNVDGTEHLIAACQAQPEPPALLFTSTFDVHGYTLDKPPPRRVTDPVAATNAYTEHKIRCEQLVAGSGLRWCVLRLTDVPILGPRDPHPIMFEIGLENRIEAMHADDAGLAIANALTTPQVWDRTLFVGGGESCQLTYREYLTRLLAAMGVPPLPESAFSTAEYATDWVDSGESEALLHYQRHTFDDIAAAVAAGMGWRRRLASAA